MLNLVLIVLLPFVECSSYVKATSFVHSAQDQIMHGSLIRMQSPVTVCVADAFRESMVQYFAKCSRISSAFSSVEGGIFEK